MVIAANRRDTMTLKYNSTTTLNRIREGSPESGRACADGWENLLKTLGKTKGDDEPIDLLTVLNSNGLDDAMWVLSYAMPDDRLARHFQAWRADQLLHLFESEYPNDTRVRDQIAMLRNDDATDEERDAALAAARAAARAASGAAACDAAWDAAWDVSCGAWYAECKRQEKQLRNMLGETQ